MDLISVLLSLTSFQFWDECPIYRIYKSTTIIHNQGNISCWVNDRYATHISLIILVPDLIRWQIIGMNVSEDILGTGIMKLSFYSRHTALKTYFSGKIFQRLYFLIKRLLHIAIVVPWPCLNSDFG